MSAIEYGVRWPETGEIEPVESRDVAEFLAKLHGVWNPVVVSRQVTYGEWTEGDQ